MDKTRFWTSRWYKVLEIGFVVQYTPALEPWTCSGHAHGYGYYGWWGEGGKYGWRVKGPRAAARPDPVRCHHIRKPEQVIRRQRPTAYARTLEVGEICWSKRRQRAGGRGGGCPEGGGGCSERGGGCPEGGGGCPEGGGGCPGQAAAAVPKAAAAVPKAVASPQDMAVEDDASSLCDDPNDCVKVDAADYDGNYKLNDITKNQIICWGSIYWLLCSLIGKNDQERKVWREDVNKMERIYCKFN